MRRRGSGSGSGSFGWIPHGVEGGEKRIRLNCDAETFCGGDAARTDRDGNKDQARGCGDD